jgi:hypothetical protein
MNEKIILLMMLSLSIVSLILIVVFNYNVKFGWDKLLGRHVIYYEVLKNDWDIQTGRWSKYELFIIPLPLFLNFLHKEE